MNELLTPLARVGKVPKSNFLVAVVYVTPVMVGKVYVVPLLTVTPCTSLTYTVVTAADKVSVRVTVFAVPGPALP